MTIRWRERYSEEEESARSRRERAGLQQWHLNLAVVLILAIVVGLLVWLIPEVRFVAQMVFGVLLATILFLVNLVVWVLTWVLVLFIPLIFGVLIFLGVNWLDKQVGRRDEDIPQFVHWLIALILGFGVFYLWMYAPGSITTWPFWMKGWLWFDVPGPHESLQWGWGIWGAIWWLIGYLGLYYMD